MIFVTEVGFLILLCPAGIRVLLRFHIGILLKPFRDFASFDLSIFFAIVSLPGNIDKTGVDYLTLFRLITLLIELLIKLIK
jgi:hypothetical protein